MKKFLGTVLISVAMMALTACGSNEKMASGKSKAESAITIENNTENVVLNSENNVVTDSSYLTAESTITTNSEVSNSNDNSQNEKAEEITKADFDGSAYLTLLQENEEDWNNYTWQLKKAVSRPIAFYDVTGDGIPEMFIMRTESARNKFFVSCYLYTINQNNQAEELDNELFLWFSDSNPKETSGYSHYYFYAGNDGALYLVIDRFEGGGNGQEYPSVYKMVNKDGMYTWEKYMYNFYDDYYGMIENPEHTYVVGDTSITKEEYENTYNTLAENATEILLHNQYFAEAVEEMEAPDTSMSWDMAYEFLSE